MMRPSTFFFLTRRGVRNLGKHWAMTIACIASLSVCMTLNIFASLAEVNVGNMLAYLGSQNETVVYLGQVAQGDSVVGLKGVVGLKFIPQGGIILHIAAVGVEHVLLGNVLHPADPDGEHEREDAGHPGRR